MSTGTPVAQNDLKAEIVRRGWKFKDLAERLGITNRHLSEVMNGRARLTHRLALQIHETTEIPMDDIPHEAAATRILVSDPIADDGVSEFKEHGFEVDVKTGLTPDDLKKIIGGYDALVVRSETKVTAEVFAAGKRLRVVGRAGVGVDNIDLDAATERGVIVVNAPLGNTISAAEHAIGLMLALARHIPRRERIAEVRASGTARSSRAYEVRGKTLGLIGLGNVGSEVARSARRASRCSVIARDPYISAERAAVLGVELVGTLDELLERSDFLSLHTA